MRSEKFYAVQHGDNFWWDFGSTVYSKALQIAKEWVDKNKFEDEEIRIATIVDGVCASEEIIREGER